ncbi:hypothetical protein K503DRAFT_768845 [Rhizopogon vinicolor AM-OR11-026]|uniref:BTB domain-containing protein n=1 Tax=Rhizopogon vinicolor AM-OR11-026 TaxID=1314800 RepID=A0A1B7N5N0_9AGAM|nr:hypothetical protein K503DRAFT_768845 [Rhizopogon vinicolor AM-OR11-026]
MPDEKTSTAQAPFDNPDCDIILRSCDGVTFRVFKLILSLASPMFKVMFTLPQAGLQSDDLSSDDLSVPVIPMTETSTTMKSLLLLCYPTANPIFNSLADAKAVLEAARKYDMEGTLSRTRDLVMAQFSSADPLELYVLSCRFGRQHHAQAAAARTLEIKDLGIPKSECAGLQDITGLDYQRLLIYHHKCGVAAQAVPSSLLWVMPEPPDMCMWTCTRQACRSPLNYKNIFLIAKKSHVITSWFDEYIVSTRMELLARPCESTLYESESYDRAVGKAVTCSECLPNAVVHMAKFRSLIAAEVKKAVGNVSLIDWLSIRGSLYFYR